MKWLFLDSTLGSFRVIMPASSFSWGIRETVAVNVGFSVAAGLLAYYLMKQYIPLFIQRKLYGQDQCKVRSSFMIAIDFQACRLTRSPSRSRWVS